MKKIILQGYIIIFFLTATEESNAQIINIESARMQSDTIGWMGSAGAGYSVNKAVHSISKVEAATHLQYKTEKDLWLFLGSYGFQRGDTENFENNSFIHIRYNRKLNSVIRWEIFAQLQNNLVTEIDSRFLLGTGPRFKILSTKVIRLYAASLAMYEREREHVKPVIMHYDARSSSYISFTITPEKGVEIISTTYYQPLFKQISDYRVSSQASVKVKPGKHFALSMIWNYLHDSRPAGTSPKTTYSFDSGVSYEF